MLRKYKAPTAMIPAGYMSKKPAVRPEWLRASGVEEICTVSGCISKPFTDYASYWKHNGYWFFNSPEDIRQLCRSEHIDTSGYQLFYYEVFEKEFDRDSGKWSTFEPDASFPTRVLEASKAHLVGYDVTTFSQGNSPECSPLSCSSLATELAVNRHCLFDTFDQAMAALESGKFDHSEPGPFRIFAVYRIES